MDCYFSSIILVKHLENLLVLWTVKVELILLLNFTIRVILTELGGSITRFDMSILIFIGHKTRAHFYTIHILFRTSKFVYNEISLKMLSDKK